MAMEFRGQLSSMQSRHRYDLVEVEDEVCCEESFMATCNVEQLRIFEIFGPIYSSFRMIEG